ncbi:TolC family protein [Euzebyella marina]|uniref:TolC family protein n=1 Tax=Euzebyella marina TaxID=1761453 RepID=A0A3G2LAX5_9FLAO|nr:TolC family protein [Euzebyella marina]AYN69394.1 TolC family protein [Euzebyella marina]
MSQLVKFLVFILLWISAKLAAQETWTLDACVSYALEHNLQLKDYSFNTASDRETYRQSIRSLLPTVTGSANYVVNYGRSTDPFTNDIVTTDFFSNNYSLETSVDIFRGFQKLNSIKATKFLYKATQEETLQQRYLLAFRVMQAFYDIKFFKGLVAISKEQMEVSQANYDLVAKQIELGLKAGADLYEAESLLLTDKLNLTQSENQLAAAELQLIQEMNLEGADSIEIQNDFLWDAEKESHSPMVSDTIYKQATEFMPILKAQELRVRAAKKQLAVQRGGLLPSLSLFAGKATGYFETTRDSLGVTVPFRDQFRDNTSQYIGVSLNVPISNGWSTRSRIKQQKIERMRAENNLMVQKQVVYQTIQQLVQEYESLEVQLEQSTQKVQAQELAFTIAQKRYEKGLINALELFTAKNLFASAQNENLQVELQSEINKSTLDFYRGLPVFDIE